MNKKTASRNAEAISYVIVLSLILLGFYGTFASIDYAWNWGAIWSYRKKFIDGFMVTIAISSASLVASLIIGTLIALAREYGSLYTRTTARIYLELVRGTPLLVQILIFFYVIANFLDLRNRYVAGVLSLSFFAGAYVSEIIRSGLNSVGSSQLDSARAIGLSSWQTMAHIIVPQAARVLIPPLTGQFVSLIKDSSLLSVIAISELTLNTQEVNSFTYSTLESYVPLAILYLAITLPLSLLTRALETRVGYES